MRPLHGYAPPVLFSSHLAPFPLVPQVLVRLRVISLKILFAPPPPPPLFLGPPPLFPFSSLHLSLPPSPPLRLFSNSSAPLSYPPPPPLFTALSKVWTLLPFPLQTVNSWVVIGTKSRTTCVHTCRRNRWHVPRVGSSSATTRSSKTT